MSLSPAGRLIRPPLLSPPRQDELDHRLVNAVEQNNRAQALSALADGADPNGQLSFGSFACALSAAIRLFNEDMTRLLLAAGADPNKPYPALPSARPAAPDSCPLLDAARRPNFFHEGGALVIGALLAAGALVDGPEGLDPPLACALECANSAAALLLMERGADPFLPQRAGLSPLELAREGSPERLALLALIERKSLEASVPLSPAARKARL